MKHVLLALALTGALLSMYFTFEMLRATFVGVAALGAIATALLFQTSQYVYTFALPSIRRRWAPVAAVTLTVATLYVLSVAASYLYMEKAITDEIAISQKAHVEALASKAAENRAADAALVRNSQAVKIAQDAYTLAIAQVQSIDGAIETTQRAAARDTEGRFRSRGLEALSDVATLRTERQVAMATSHTAGDALRVALELAAPLRGDVDVATVSPMFKQVSDTSRQVLLMLIAALIEVCTLMALVLRNALSEPVTHVALPAPPAPAEKPVKASQHCDDARDLAPKRPMRRTAPTVVPKPATPPDSKAESAVADKLRQGAYGPQPSQRAVIRDSGLPERRIRAIFNKLATEGALRKEGKAWVM